jgi:cell division protein FtsL
MELSIIILLSVTVLLLVFTVVLLVRSHLNQDNELQKKNDIIVREVRRNQELLSHIR